MSTPPSSRGKAATIAVRAGALACMVLAALDAAWPDGGSSRDPLRVVDVSASLGPAAADPDAGTGSGGDRLLFADGWRATARGEERATLARERTRLADALRAAGERLGKGPGRVWLVTDGRDTEGGGEAAAARLREAGLVLDVSAPSPPAADVGLAYARIRSEAPGGPREIGVGITSSVSGLVRVTLRRGTLTVDAKDVPLSPAATPDFVLRDGPEAPSDALYEVALVPLDGTPDDDDANDRLTLVARGVEPRVVIFDRSPWRAPLPTIGPVISAEEAQPAEFEAADTLVVSDAPLARSAAVADRLSRHVLLGGTLLLLGGPESFGPGGWRGTPIEALSPLRSRAPDEGETAVVVMLDASGSTGESPVGGGPTTHEALADALDTLLADLPPAARALVVPFRDRPASAVEPTWISGGDVVARRRVVESVRSASASGGTDLPTAVSAGARLARDRTSARRRIVVLATDGDPDHTLDAASFSAARTALVEGAAEFLAVVRGDTATATALESLAGSRDRVALIDRAGGFSEALARLFRKATNDAEVARGGVTVSEGRGQPYASGLSGLVPSAVHRLEAAPTADVFALARRDGEAPTPFGASWSIGAGRVVALAWGPAFETGDGVEASRRALAPLLARLAHEADRGLVGDDEGGRFLVRAPAGLGRLLVRRGVGSPASLLETAPGVYEGAGLDGSRGPIGEPLLAETSVGAWRPVRLPARPPPEHRGSGVDAAALEALARAGGGRRLAPGESPTATVSEGRTSLAPWLLALSMALLVLDRLRDEARFAGRSATRAPSFEEAA